MPSPYLDRPLLPLAVTLPRMLAQIETELPMAQPAKLSNVASEKEPSCCLNCSSKVGMRTRHP